MKGQADLRQFTGERKPDAWHWLKVHFGMTKQDVQADIEKRKGGRK